jgi:hypothetical protein
MFLASARSVAFGFLGGLAARALVAQAILAMLGAVHLDVLQYVLPMSMASGLVGWSAGGWIAARTARRRPVLHAAIVGSVIAAWALASGQAVQPGVRWAIAAIDLAAAVGGGVLASRNREPRAESESESELRHPRLVWLGCAALSYFYVGLGILWLIPGPGFLEGPLLLAAVSTAVLAPFIAAWPTLAARMPALDRSLLLGLVVVQIGHATLVVLFLAFGPVRGGPHDMGMGAALTFLLLEAGASVGFLLPRLFVPGLGRGSFVRRPTAPPSARRAA